MRTELEMLRLIIRTAEEDERIRGVYLSGSRVNPNAPKDIFQDYDIVYAVRETRSFRDDKGWIDLFGERLYMQYPEGGVYSSADVEKCYGWLIQFADGNRLDLHVCRLQNLPERLAEDKMYRVLLDKDGCLPATDVESDRDFWVNRLTEEQFLATCNEFWWCMNNVAKGLWRHELLYVLDMLNTCVRPMLTRLLENKIGLETDFSVSVGKASKDMHRWLPPALWERYLRTYSTAETGAIWDAVFLMCALFDEVALEISARSNFLYNTREAQNSRSYLEHVHRLPPTAAAVY